MQASKVTITPETRAAAERPLSRADRHNMQREQIMAYIRNKPAGTPINVRKMGERIGLIGNQLIQLPLFLQRMVRDRLITMEGEKGTEYRTFTVLTDVKTIPPEPQPEPESVPPPQPPVSNHTLSVYAKEFAWEKDSDSLREFVGWMDGKELDLRRLIDGGGGY